MNILITGGNGYLGGNLARYLRTKYNVLIGTSNSQVIKKKNILYSWDDYRSLLVATKKIDLIIHASGVGSKECENNPHLAYKINVEGTELLVNAAIENRVKKIIYLSSAHVYDNPLAGIINEKTLVRNDHPYAKTKFMAENILKKKDNEKKIQSVILRLSNVIGSPISKKSNCWQLVAHDLVLQAMRNENLYINNNPNIERDFLSMTSFIKIIDEIINFDHKKNKDSKVYNIGSGVTKKIIDLAELIKDRSLVLYKKNLPVSFDKEKNTSTKKFIYDVSKSKKIIPIKKIILNESLTEDIDSLLVFCQRSVK